MRDVDYQIVGHKEIPAGGLEIGQYLQLLVRESGGDGGKVWVHEDVVVDPHLLAACFKKEGEARLAAAADRRRKRAQDRGDRARQHADEMAAIADSWSEFTEEERGQILSERSTAEDLGASVQHEQGDRSPCTAMCQNCWSIVLLPVDWDRDLCPGGFWMRKFEPTVSLRVHAGRPVPRALGHRT